MVKAAAASALTALTLETPIQYAKGVGAARALELIALNVHTCGDLLNYYPRDYLRYVGEKPIAQVRPGELATVRGRLVQTQLIRRKPQRFQALLEDDAGTRCVLTWFHAFGLERKLTPGVELVVTGKTTLYMNRLQFSQPKYEFVTDEEEAGAAEARIEAVYPAAENLSSNVIQKIVGSALEPLVEQVPEMFPVEHLKARGYYTRRAALLKIHQPATLAEAKKARHTLAYHEFFLHQAAVAIKRYHQRMNQPAPALRTDATVDRRIRALLEFTLTPAQDRVIEAIRQDLAQTRPMNRLLQGDVGSGKTVVALYAMLAAVATGHQAALMAPTEILAEQHYLTLARYLQGKKVKVGLLVGGQTAREREEVLRQLASGALGLVVGTHALLGEAVAFASLALVVIDEQHKFGVEHRSVLRSKTSATGTVPHTLVMTATPIPRTLAMTAFGDLDVSVIDELPPGRVPIVTRMTPAANREEVYHFVAKRLQAGEQAYVVLPTIDEGELDLRSARGVEEELRSGWLKDFHVGLMHGRQDRATRQHIMERFRQKLIDVLVSTTVIEVGVDVPNATVMVIEHADRFGLSQLHQLRGRVGRSNKKSVCVLLGDLTTDEGIQRLQAMVRHASGFKIAEEDLQLRGFGQIIGTQQSGRSDMKFPELLMEGKLLHTARRDAFAMVAADPRLLEEKHRVLRQMVLSRFGDMISLADVG